MGKSKIAIACSLLLISLCLCAPTRGDVVSAVPIYDAHVDLGSDTPTLNHTEIYMRSSWFPNGNPPRDNRAVMEYDLSEIPRGSEIISAALMFDIGSRNYHLSDYITEFSIYTYAGDGVASIIDPTHTDYDAALNVQIKVDRRHTIPLELSSIQQAIDLSSYVGLITKGTDHGTSLGICSLETIRFGRIPPTLIIEYDPTTIPTPASATFVFVGMLGLLTRRKKLS